MMDSVKVNPNNIKNLKRQLRTQDNSDPDIPDVVLRAVSRAQEALRKVARREEFTFDDLAVMVALCSVIVEEIGELEQRLKPKQQRKAELQKAAEDG